MKNLIVGLILGLLINGLVSYAQERIIINPFQGLGRYGYGEYYTTKINTPEGAYRIFSVLRCGGNGGVGITAIKIN